MITALASLCLTALLGVAQPPHDLPDDTMATSSLAPKRVYTTQRLTTGRPLIDGKLDDPCWQAGTWAGDFTQWIPREGAKPSQPTLLKILYDDDAIYVAIRAIDLEPDLVLRRGGARDQFMGDMTGISFDSYHDHRTGFEFDLTAAGQKIDLVLTNPMITDMNWNAVWDGKVGNEDTAWTAEFAIPLHQLRYSSDDVQTWGLHCWRWIDRFQEESDWEIQSSTGPGSIYQFGELHGLRGLPSPRRIEIMPFTLGKLKTSQAQAGDPFARNGRQWLGNGGLDAKIGLTSNFTADLTVNPDFGQVEADPSVMNLSVFETFYEEKRPFFLEGKNIFSFDFDDVNMFYSRRVGHPPSYTPALASGEFMKFPDYTSILGALKVSGKTAGGLAVGVFEGLTAEELATVGTGAAEHHVAVEPLTSSTVARLQQDFAEGSTMVGGILTATNRMIRDPHLDFLNRNAYTGGVDLQHYWNDKEFYVAAKIVGSTITGSRTAITELQTASARYYQRPDVSDRQFDSSRTRLSGFGGEIKVAKASKGFWRYSTQLDWRSPGLDLNDLGYMQTADLFKLTNAVSFFVNQPVGIFRTYNVGLTQSSQWDFGLHPLSTTVGADLYGEFLNNWALGFELSYTGQSLDPRILRGGPAMLTPGEWFIESHFRTDPSAAVVFNIENHNRLLSNSSGHMFSLAPSLSIVPVTTLRVELGMDYSSELNSLQYVDAPAIDGSARYLLGRIKRKSIGATFRTDWNITNTVSLRYYGSPFGSVGNYSEFKEVSNPRSGQYNDRFIRLNPRLENGTYGIFADGMSVPGMTFGDPDFTFGQFRSVLVFRWEYLPGSQFYVVWTQERTRYVQPGAESAGGSIQALGKTPATNVFLMKMSYWFTI
jgi:hypothetical protein